MEEQEYESRRKEEEFDEYQDYNAEYTEENKRINETLFELFKKEEEEKAYWKKIYEEHQRKEWKEYEEYKEYEKRI